MQGWDGGIHRKSGMFPWKNLQCKTAVEQALFYKQFYHPPSENLDEEWGVFYLKGAVKILRLLGAIDEKRDLTQIGKLMVKFPIIPRLSRMIVASIMEYPDVMEEVLIASAFLNDRAPFLLPHGFELEARKAHHSFRHKLGDFVSYLKIFRRLLELLED